MLYSINVLLIYGNNPAISQKCNSSYDTNFTLYNQCLTPLKISQNKRKTKEMFKLDQTNLSKGIDVKTCGKPQEKSNSSAPGNNYVIHNNK